MLRCCCVLLWLWLFAMIFLYTASAWIFNLHNHRTKKLFFLCTETLTMTFVLQSLMVQASACFLF